MKTCKICKKKFEVQYSSTQVVCSFECSFEKVRRDQNKRIKQEAKAWREKKKNELISIPDMLKIAEGVFNTYIRLRDKDQKCISCGGELGLKYDAGHRWSVKNYIGIRFHEDNVFAQCVNCNQHRNGNEGEYRIGLEKRIGIERVRAIDEIRHRKIKWDRQDLNELINTYKEKIKELKNN